MPSWRFDAVAARLSGPGPGGIPSVVPQDRSARAARWLALVGGLAMAAGSGSGCGLKGLAHDQLYGTPDAAIDKMGGGGGGGGGSEVGPAEMPPEAGATEASPGDVETDADAGSGTDVMPDADASQGGDTALDAAPDGGADGTSDVVPDGADVVPDGAAPDGAALDSGDGDDGAPVKCTAASCSSDQFCDDLGGQCLPRVGTGMISGAAYDACRHTSVNAKVGIAGRHACTSDGKGGFYFTGIPLGRLTLAAAAGGYELFVKEVTIVPGGNTLEIPLIRAAPTTCDDAPPTPTACSCLDPTCGP